MSNIRRTRDCGLSVERNDAVTRKLLLVQVAAVQFFTESISFQQQSCEIEHLPWLTIGFLIKIVVAYFHSPSCTEAHSSHTTITFCPTAPAKFKSELSLKLPLPTLGKLLFLFLKKTCKMELPPSKILMRLIGDFIELLSWVLGKMYIYATARFHDLCRVPL